MYFGPAPKLPIYPTIRSNWEATPHKDNRLTDLKLVEEPRAMMYARSDVPAFVTLFAQIRLDKAELRQGRNSNTISALWPTPTTQEEFDERISRIAVVILWRDELRGVYPKDQWAQITAKQADGYEISTYFKPLSDVHVHDDNCEDIMFVFKDF